jgi:hypothetical protein
VVLEEETVMETRTVQVVQSGCGVDDARWPAVVVKSLNDRIFSEEGTTTRVVGRQEHHLNRRWPISKRRGEGGRETAEEEGEVARRKMIGFVRFLFGDVVTHF